VQPPHACIRKKNVETTEPPPNFVENPIQLARCPNIGTQGQDVALKLAGCRVQPGLISSSDDDLCAFVAEQFCGLEPFPDVPPVIRAILPESFKVVLLDARWQPGPAVRALDDGR
jgi:hypothetical protein